MINKISFYRYLLIILIFVTALGSPKSALSEQIDLAYELTYSGLKLATVLYSESDFYTYETENVKDLNCEIISISDFININGKYRSIISEKNSVKYYNSETVNQANKRLIEYWFEYDNNKIRIKDSRIIGADTTSRFFEKVNQKPVYLLHK